MGFWIFVLIISIVVLFVKVSGLGREYEETIAGLKRELLELRALVRRSRTSPSGSGP